MPTTKPKPKPKQPTLPPYVEGGFINDASGAATAKERQRLKAAPKPLSQADPIEEGLRRIYRMTAMAGFDPLGAQEIEQILAKVEPATAMPGVKPTPPDPREREQQLIAATHRALKAQGSGADSGGAGTALRGDSIINPNGFSTADADPRDALLRGPTPPTPENVLPEHLRQPLLRRRPAAALGMT